ncbi:methionyl-tRNA synthetase [Planctopirus limnophila DSM 3776]|uniref:Methionine--tRNA ligase n=1 Tax=Planctopirus limnophila (strain ATCC 43296 / DSM 3776 / IFAM 1008 / Mu 290) TaxID=521674 RepID=D5STY2_PLAL2|nr:methionine--tRNA ligase [Planctopirus limnophila]ADG66967.1 methionyl-tRNA synthetase [Planctopirus limnophila DSM 3776]
MTRQILVTSALPYANGHIHIGHLVEYLQTDIWVRFQKLVGNRCVYVCADDTHGTAIMIRARQEGRSELEVIGEMRESHLKDFTGFGIEFDNYGSTHSDENRALCAEIWQSLRQADLIVERNVERFYDPVEETFLADRFIKGTCPKCGAEDQYGDNCDKCGSTYDATEVINPISTLSGATPVRRESLQLFVELEKLHGWLNEWTQTGGHLQEEIANYLQGHFLNDPLRDWDVSRPARYFGFEIPDSPGNYWYVWFDAPIGYIASTHQWCKANGEKLEDWWKSDRTEIHHFIGKDITYFHTLFWPAMLKTAGLNLPKKVHIHGFLRVNGEKMSKSKGTFVMASTYLKHLDPAYLRYYYASKLSSRVEDLDLNLDEFVARINSDLVGKVVNLASRTARFAQPTGLSAQYPDDGGLFAEAAAEAGKIAELYEACEYAQAMRAIMVLAEKANKYVEDNAPWTLKKDPAQAGKLQDVCTVALNLFRQLAVYLAPVLPQLAEQTGRLLNAPMKSWDEAQTPLVASPVNLFEHLMKRVDPAQVQAMTEESQSAPAAAPAATPQVDSSSAAATPAPTTANAFGDTLEALTKEPLTEAYCSIDDFVKVDLRVGRVLTADFVDGSDKLLKLTLSLGGDVTKTIFAGIRQAYEPATLVGRMVVFCANLAPRKMRFGTSEGMVLAAGEGGTQVFVLSPDSGAKVGHRIH